MEQANKFWHFLKEPEKTIILASAHSGISAKLVEEAGFDGIWASGLEISTLHGVPDASILSMSEHLAVVSQMARAVNIPIIVDCDSGYGNAINVIHTVSEFERAGAAGICIEDNPFPKQNSFYDSGDRLLVSIEEFSGKIRAAKMAQKNPGFTVIARTEAIIAGLGVQEALKRARAYVAAGADMIVVHSKKEVADELAEFAREWDGKAPLVAIPTKYKNTSAGELKDMGYKMVIFANHTMRSAIKAMKETLGILIKEQRAASVDDKVCSLKDMESLVGHKEMQENEKRFLSAKH